jgi:predicted AAA+ superfamily ATPase
MDVHFARGALFENLIIAEVKKHIFNNALNIRPYFWRDNNGNEIDLLLCQGNQINTIEIKASQGYKSEFSKGFAYWDNLNTRTNGKKSVVYTGEIQTKTRDYNLVNWQNLNKIFG